MLGPVVIVHKGVDSNKSHSNVEELFEPRGLASVHVLEVLVLIVDNFSAYQKAKILTLK